MITVTFREERGKNGDFFFRVPVPESTEGRERFDGYYRKLTALLSSLSPERTGFSSVTGTGRVNAGPDGSVTVLLLYRFYREDRLAFCFSDAVTWDDAGNAVPSERLIGKKAAKKAVRDGNDGWYLGKDGVTFFRYRAETDPGSGRVRAVFRETGTVPVLCRKKERGLRKNC